jgi:hypothetical protein
MKEIFLVAVLALSALISGALAMGPSDRGALLDENSATFFDVVSIRDAVAAMPEADLNESETEGLLYMR